MPINKRIIPVIGLLCVLGASAGFAFTITVGKTVTADCKTINEALKKAAAGDVIKIMDVSTYEEQVNIDSNKFPLTLTSKDPTSLNKPIIKFQDRTHVGPKTAAEAKIDSLINFDQNGAIRIIKARNIIIDGIAVDGGGVYPFGYPSIWESRYGLQHGNACITIWVSGDVIIRNCDLSNAYFGINFKDRNLGGIFANPNPADLDTQNNVPLSGFALTGNHLIERNRIHDNSWGMFFESSWDLGTTIRYNLIWDCHHPTKAIATAVKGLTSDEGANQPGGAFFFKDDELSPLAIYNNTLWHNFALLAGHWQSGYQHLVFNNIFGPPNEYWQDATPSFNTDPMELSSAMPNRIYSCIYSAQVQAPQASYVRIMNNFPQLQGAGGVAPDPGTVIAATAGNPGFPATANNRWLEMTSSLFLSTNPTSPNFLEPNWADESVISFIVQKGWQKSGVKNTDGTWADLGAIEQAKGTPSFIGTIKPSPLPIIIQGGNAQITFSLDEREGTTMTKPTIKLFRLVRIKYVKGPFGNGEKTMVIATTDMTDLAVPAAPPVKVGPNSYSVSASITGDFAFIEMIIEATGADGKQFTTATGFIPYRKLDYIFKVEVLDKAAKTVLTETHVGDTVTLRLTPQKIGGAAFTNQINAVQVTLISGFVLLDAGKNPLVELEYPSGVTGQTDRPVVFTKIPDGNIENITAAGKYKNPSTGSVLPFIGGTSIKVLSGPPELVLFQNPPSRTKGLIPPQLPAGYAYPCTLFVYDKYGNQVNSPAQVAVQSITTDFANVIGGHPDTTITTDASGVGTFRVKTENAAREGYKVTFRGNVIGKTLADSADMIVGPRAEHLFIFYSDTLKYDPADSLSGQVGDRLQIIVIATKSDNPTIDSIIVIPATFTISGSNQKMLFYESPTAPTATNSFTLVNGRVTLWVSSSEELANASVSLRSDDIIATHTRDQIYFTRPVVSIDSAFYYTRKGFGQVDSVDIFFKEKLALIPDSIVLFWPLKVDNNPAVRRVVFGTDPAMRLWPDSMRVTIILANPFPAEITATKSADRLGITYNRPNNNPGVQQSSLTFPIAERVGPLLMSALAVERITNEAGAVDTMTVSFSEVVSITSITGDALVLIQNGSSSKLTVKSATSLGNNRFLLVVSSTTKPKSGDSLRINPAGLIIDSLGNSAHILNRPVPLQIKIVPAGIVMAYYLDNERDSADGVVDSVVIQFNKKVDISNIELSLEWTGAGGLKKADNLSQNLMSYRGSDSSTIEVFVRGQFSGLLVTAVRTAGAMNATVKYTSLNESVAGNVVDSAAPVCVDSALYKPGSRPANQANYPDTLYVTFSEPVIEIDMNYPKPFITWDPAANQYKLMLVMPDVMVPDWKNDVDKYQYKFIVSSISGIDFPKNGDFLWIDPFAAIKDGSKAVQDNAKNRRVPLHVYPIPYDISVTIEHNPVDLSSSKPEMRVMRVRIEPNTKMIEEVKLTAGGQIYDGLGNLLHTIEDQAFNPNAGAKNGLVVEWNCFNKNQRQVGTGVYVFNMSIKKDGYVIQNPIKKIGVKR
jgi:hypothetical protein